MREQRKLTFYISGDLGEFNGFERAIARTASKICGGCTIFHGEGWWIPGAADFARSIYAGKADWDDVLILTVTCETNKVDLAYKRIREGIVSACIEHAVMTDWVHVTEEAISGRHFSVHSRISQREEDS